MSRQLHGRRGAACSTRAALAAFAALLLLGCGAVGEGELGSLEPTPGSFQAGPSADRALLPTAGATQAGDGLLPLPPPPPPADAPGGAAAFVALTAEGAALGWRVRRCAHNCSARIVGLEFDPKRDYARYAPMVLPRLLQEGAHEDGCRHLHAAAVVDLSCAFTFHEGTFHSIHDCLVPNARLWQHAAALLAAAGGAAAAGIGADGGGEAVVVALLHTPAQARFVELLLAPLPAHTAAIELHPSSRKQCFNLRTPGAVAFDAGPHLVAPQFRREGHWRNASHADRAALAQAAAALRGWAHARAGVPPPPAHARAAAARLRAAQAAADGSATRGSGHVGPPAGARHDERRPPSGGDEAPVLLTIKRHGARRVNNQTEMDESLHECMPWMRHVAYHGNESIAETVRLFASARAVVGPHGAGHSNTYWAAPGTTVVELVLHLSDGHTWRRTDKVVAARGHDITWVAVSHPLVVPPDDSQLVSWWAGYEEGRTRDWGVYHQKSRQFKNESGFNFAQHAPSIVVPVAALETTCSVLRATLLPFYSHLEA